MVKDGVQQQGGGRGGNVDAGDGASASAEVVHCQVKRIKQEDVEKGMEQAPSTESRRAAAGFGGPSTWGTDETVSGVFVYMVTRKINTCLYDDTSSFCDCRV
ncbi:uncharacterized protein A4U43_C03F15580 [Asparagus officinalis]|uniref:Uncharacterized protein n=1 Tax=Asparagus officinalis TaxID=4686 RepID=A0A5P1FAA6_ASPOF|nr:uncharacterized protein A4U43_C03F15580 [Asparagus officinalis]